MKTYLWKLIINKNVHLNKKMDALFPNIDLVLFLIRAFYYYIRYKLKLFTYKNLDFPSSYRGIINTFEQKQQTYCTRIYKEDAQHNGFFESLPRFLIGPLLTIQKKMFQPLTVTRPVSRIPKNHRLKLKPGYEYWFTLENKRRFLALINPGDKSIVKFIHNKKTSFSLSISNSRYTKLTVTKKLELKSSNKSIVYNRFPISQNKKIHIHYLFIDALPYFGPQTHPIIYDNFKNCFKSFRNQMFLHNNYSSSDWTMPSLTSILVGLPVHRHGVIDPGDNLSRSNIGDAINPEHQTLFEVAEAQGFSNTVISANSRMNPFYGHSRGVQNFYHKPNMGSEQLLTLWKNQVAVDLNKNSVFFLNFMDVHHPIQDSSLEILDSEMMVDQVNSGIFLNFWETERELYSTTNRLFKDIAQHCDLINSLSKVNTNIFIITSDHSSVRTLKGQRGGHAITDRFHVPFILMSNQEIGPIGNNNNGLINSPAITQIMFNSFKDKSFNIKNFRNELVKFTNKDEYVYSEIIYPGQTYRVQIISLEFIFFLETPTELKNRVIDLTGLEVKTFDRMQNKFIENNFTTRRIVLNFLHDLKKFSVLEIVGNFEYITNDK